MSVEKKLDKETARLIQALFRKVAANIAADLKIKAPK
jgi:hypothetical protein